MTSGKSGTELTGPAPERLHKFLASTGAGSRRECETFVSQGRVTVNGKVVTKMGLKVVPGTDVVTFDGERVRPERRVYFLLNKPPGYICTNSDERGRPRAMDLVPDKRQRVYTVGRLDADSRGLILLTNDGAIANIICHPRYRVEKVYEASVRGRVTREHVTKLEHGVWLAEGKSSPAKVRPLEYDPKRGETRMALVLFEGRNREIRRVFAKVGLKVKRLRRTRIGPLLLDDLSEGACAVLSPADLRFVYEAERLYKANRELWDAELPPPPKGPGRGRKGGGGRPPARGGGAHDTSAGPAGAAGRTPGRAPGARSGQGGQRPKRPAQRGRRRYYP
jgi:23S rRNA pseudouridine2605 synthase